MGETGILPPEARVELIEGEIIDMAPNGSPHAGTTDQLASILMAASGGRFLVRQQNPLRLDDFSEPVPDIALLRPRADRYKASHPGPADVFLLIEVASSSLRYDVETKAALYARHGIPELWIVDLVHEALLRFREVAEGGYARSDRPGLTEPVGIAALPDLGIDLSCLFA